MNPVEQAKANGNYRRAGQLQALQGRDRSYGCHFGMRSGQYRARMEFEAGYDEVEFCLRCGDTTRN